MLSQYCYHSLTYEIKVLFQDDKTWVNTSMVASLCTNDATVVITSLLAEIVPLNMLLKTIQASPYVSYFNTLASISILLRPKSNNK